MHAQKSNPKHIIFKYRCRPIFALWALDVFLYIRNVKRFKALSFEPGNLETITQDISKESQTFKPLIPYF